MKCRRTALQVVLFVVLLSLLPGFQQTYAQTILLSPASGNVGSSVTVTGSGFLPGNKQVIVYYDLTKQVGNATTSSAGAFTVTFAVPSSARGGHTVLVTDGTNSASATFTVTSSLSRSPTSGVVGTTITLSGYGYSASSTITVRWDGTTLATSPATVTTDSGGAFSATVLAPPGEPVSHSTVASDAGGSVTVTFTLTRNIVLSSISGPVGTLVLVTGSGYLATNPIIITFDGSVVSTTPALVTSDGLGGFAASFNIPATSPGAHKVRATDNTGGYYEATFTATPSISLSPTSGRAGTALTVTGTGFAPLSTATIRFNGALVLTAPTDSSGGFSVVFPVPLVAAGTHTVSATDGVGSVATAIFSVTPLISITPANGVVGTIVIVTGAGFSSSSAIALLFAGSPVVTTPGTITTDANGGFTASFSVPEISAGSWSVLAVDSSNLRSSATFTVARRVSLSSASGTFGTVIIARGTGFFPSTQVLFIFDGAILVTIPSTVLSDADGRFNASFTVPETIQGSHVIIADDLLGYPVSVAFTVNPIITLSPTSGNPGTVVTVTGKGFGPNTLMAISFDGSSVATSPSPVETDALGSFTAIFTIGPSIPGSHTVKASDLFGNSDGATFTTTRKISLSSHSGGVLAAITVTGFGFQPTSSITLTWSGSPLNVLPSPLVSDGTGYFVATFTVPFDVAGIHIVVATDGVGNRASDTYTIAPAISVTPSGLGVGDELWLSGTGFSGLSRVVITWDGSSVSTQPPTITTDGLGSFRASFVIPPSAFGSHRTVAVDQRGNSTSSSYTISSTSTINVETDVGAIYFRGELVEFYALVTKNGKPFDASIPTAKLYVPGGTVQDLSGAVVRVDTGMYRIDYVVSGSAAPGTYALVVNVSTTISGVPSFGSDLRAFGISDTFGKMNATITAINNRLATISLDIGPVLVKLDEINASLSSLILNSKGEILARISSTAGVITSKLDVLSASLSSVSNGMATVSTSLGSVQTELKTIEAQIASVSGDMVLVKSNVGSLNISISDLRPKLDGIKENMLVFNTDLGSLKVSLEDLELRSIRVEEKTVQIETEVGAIASMLEKLSGMTVMVRTKTGTKTVTLLAEMVLLSAGYREPESAIDIGCDLKTQSSGVLSVIIPKDLLRMLESSTSELKLGEDGKELTYSLQEMAYVYVLQTIVQDQGRHQLTLYLKGWPSLLHGFWPWILVLVPIVGAIGALYARRRRRERAQMSSSRYYCRFCGSSLERADAPTCDSCGAAQ